MRSTRFRPPLLSAPMLILALAAGSSLTAAPPDSVEFFENRIRPVLVKHCYQCHSAEAEDLAGSLLLDSPAGMMTGGDSGPAITPGDADASMLISALRYESTEMPPDGKLPDRVIDDFEQWIAAGAIDPRESSVTSSLPASEIDLEAGRQFWAFQPIRAASVPLTQAGDPRVPLDRFVDRKLDAAGIDAVESASPEVRLRRLSFDLTGLPPSPSLMRRWTSDPSPVAWRAIVDSMLASPAFAEHWARHWMDVARYADSNGADFNATHHEAWRYRDYLIRSFAADRPVDEMIRQQIAGDLLPAEDDQQRYDNVVATTFLMLGTKMLSERDKPKLTLDVVDEQIDTVGRALLGLTLGCARCHDHKFDPIPTEDYYALAGIFESTITLNGESQKYVSTWNRVPLPASDDHIDAIKRHESQLKSLEAEVKRAERALKAAKEKAANRFDGIVVDDSEASKSGNWVDSTYYKHFVGEGYVHDNNADKGDASISFSVRLPASGRYEVRIAHSPGPNRAAAVPITVLTADGETELIADQRTNQIEPMWSSLGEFRFSSQQDAVVTFGNKATSGYVIADAVQFLPLDAAEQSIASDETQKVASSESAASQDAVAVASEQLAALESRLASLKENAPPPLPEAMAPSDKPTDQIADSHVHIRGEVKNLGPVVPRGFLQVCGSGDMSIRNPRGSGRLELADWLTDPDNPLVSRVFVNRVWMHLFGEGLVRTVDNFGVQGEQPTHPELLDWLATDFVRSGWHLKPLVRRLVNSAAYQRSSRFDAEAAGIDPENRLLWRMHRRRIPAESIRDAMLSAAGSLDRQPRFEPMRDRGTLVSSNNSDSTADFDDVGRPCRSLYLPVVRGYMPPLMSMLDAAEPDLLVGKRPTTNVPAQALVLINSPDVNRWAKQTAERVIAESTEFDDRLRFAYAICLGRAPTQADHQLAESFFAPVRSDDATEEKVREAWHEWVAGLFACTEFRMLE